jgi:putative endonuclease
MCAYYVYILTNTAGVIYVGMTNDLSFRLWQHVHDRMPGFSSRYNLDRLGMTASIYIK